MERTFLGWELLFNRAAHTLTANGCSLMFDSYEVGSPRHIPFLQIFNADGIMLFFEKSHWDLSIEEKGLAAIPTLYGWC
nr:hypothetical protein [uncultured Acetobacteroides sp.]